jgi:hypothetical protein
MKPLMLYVESRGRPTWEIRNDWTPLRTLPLIGQDRGEATFPYFLVRTCHALRQKPLREFTVEDLRIILGQNFSLEYLVP